ncbi:MAG TPA: hypothetical protein VMG10_31590, partial [Gemmataceae bacterium]|nr:hypothetical protein [Gemmataceae bacterium]
HPLANTSGTINLRSDRTLLSHGKGPLTHLPRPRCALFVTPSDGKQERWRAEWTPPGRGTHRLQVRAVNRAGDGQPTTAIWNRGGYMRNVIEEVRVHVV